MTGGYTPQDLAVLIPVLGRPHHIPPLLASLDATVPGARVLFLVTPGDEAAIAACESSGREVVPVRWQPGDYAIKMQVGYLYTVEPLLFLGATDIEFQPGWFEATVAQLRPGIGVVGTNDCGNPRVMRGDHSTHSLVTREYVDRYGILQPGPDGQPVDQPGVILCPAYRHEFVDDELVGTAKYRRAWAWADAHVVHRHPDWGNPVDPVDNADAGYAAQRDRMHESWPLFRQRRLMWEPSYRRRLRGSLVRRR